MIRNMKVDCYLNLPWVTLEEEESAQRLLPGARRRAGIVLGQMRTPGDKKTRYESCDYYDDDNVTG